MKRIFTSILVLSFVALSFSLAANPAGAAGITTSSAITVASYTFNFSTTLQPWQPFASNVSEDTLKLKADSPGNKYAALTNVLSPSGTVSNGVSMLSEFAGGGNTVRVKFQARNFEGCGSCVPVVFVGTSKPVSMADFARVSATPLSKDWQTYVYEKPLKGDNIVVGIGYVDGHAQIQWAGIDNVDVSILVR